MNVPLFLLVLNAAKNGWFELRCRLTPIAVERQVAGGVLL